MEPLTHVRVQDYQSIGLADLELGAFTVIVGRGNLGKSALLRAISACIFNETGADVIRLGQKSTSVTLTFGADHTIAWEKDTKTARYRVAIPGVSENFTKLAGSVPPAVADAFNIRTIEIDKTFSIRPQIHGQFDAPLLLAESSGKAARALAKLTKLESVVAAQMAAARDLRRAKAEANARKRESEELTERLAQFPDIDSVEAGVAAAQELFTEADRRLNLLAQGEDVYHLFIDAQRRLSVEPPTLESLDGLTQRLNHVQTVLVARRVFAQALQGADYTRQATVAKNFALQSAEADLSNFLGSLEICPVCQQPIGADHAD